VTQFVLLLGTNRSDAHEQLTHAIESLNARWQVSEVTNALRTAPRDGELDIDSYLNQALLLESDLSAGELKLELKLLETQLGRIRPMPDSGICAMDIDIMLSKQAGDAWVVLDAKTLTHDYAQVALAPWLGMTA
jgi:2-amino-4-hydroxy-6-hydroxymethyldihydropteridine diphosphokinase